MSSSARLAAAGLTASTVMLLTAGLSMLQPLSTDLYLPTLPAIAAHFDASVATVQWTLSVFIAVFGAWQLVAGPLTDRYGRYPFITLGAAVYAVASVVCMAAPSIEPCWCSAARCRPSERAPAWSARAASCVTCTRRAKGRACWQAPRRS